MRRDRRQVLDEQGTEDEARQKADALKDAFIAAPEAARLPPGIGLSVGAVEVPAGTTDLRPLLTEADARMYKDKDRSRRTTNVARRL